MINEIKINILLEMFKEELKENDFSGEDIKIATDLFNVLMGVFNILKIPTMHSNFPILLRTMANILDILRTESVED